VPGAVTASRCERMQLTRSLRISLLRSPAKSQVVASALRNSMGSCWVESSPDGPGHDVEDRRVRG